MSCIPGYKANPFSVAVMMSLSNPELMRCAGAVPGLKKDVRHHESQCAY